jgi:hypothetical protein
VAALSIPCFSAYASRFLFSALLNISPFSESSTVTTTTFGEPEGAFVKAGGAAGLVDCFEKDEERQDWRM